MCEDYLITHHKSDIQKILESKDVQRQYSLNINFVELFENDPNLGNLLVKQPEEALKEWDRCLLSIQTRLLIKKEEHKHDELTFKDHVHCRIYGLPTHVESLSLTHLHDGINQFLVMSGTVVRMSAVKVLEYQRQYTCVKCKYQMTIKGDYSRRYLIKSPNKCMNPDGCNSTTYLKNEEISSDNCKDYQEIKIQEQVPKTKCRAVPNSVWVTLEDDLVESCKPGDSVTISGIPKRRVLSLTKNSKIEMDLVIKANHVHVADPFNSSSSIVLPELKQLFNLFWENYSDRPLVGRDIILKSFCQELFGLYTVKLAVAVVLAGGVHVEENKFTGVRFRSESHLLLVGDPGTGKSHILKFAASIISRSVLTTGVGSTAAGLTVAAIRENGEWQLEGGALVMSNGGICCIDEFNSMKEHDRTTIHEAMEQQTISVAKASIVCKLNTQCSILAATNPKGNLDPTLPLDMIIALGGPLLSRFDLILLLKDDLNKDWDSMLTDYILDEKHVFSKLTENVLWSTEMLQAYFITIKKINPVMSLEAHAILSKYYMAKRGTSIENKSRATVRLLDSLIRLSQGHARLMFHQTVEILDAVVAITLLESTFNGEYSLFDLNINVRSNFPPHPMDYYKSMLERILTKLNLEELLEKELRKPYMKNCCGDSNDIKSRFFVSRNLSDVTNFKNSENDEPIASRSYVDISTIVKASSSKNQSENSTNLSMDQTDESSKIIRDKGNKRKCSNSPKKQKRARLTGAKPNKDVNLINLLPSVNDDISNLVDFNCDFSEQSTSQIQNPQEKNSSLEGNDSSLNISDPVPGETKLEQNRSKNCISQNTRLKMFREEFKFKPKEKPTLLKGKSSECTSFQSTTTNESSIFQSQPEEIENLDLDI